MRRFLSAALSLSVALAAQGKPVLAEVETRTLQGRDVDVLGEPIPAATVVAVLGERVVQRATTDGEGLYHLPRVPVTGAEIRFSAPGKAEVRTTWRGLSASPFHNEVLEDAGRLQGRVRDAAGTAIAGAAVIVVADRFWGEVITNANGDYDFAAVPLRRAVVRAWTPTGCVERSVHVVGERRCDLQMRPLATGKRVVRVKGLPPEALATAHVEVTSVDIVAHKLLGRVALRGLSAGDRGEQHEPGQEDSRKRGARHLSSSRSWRTFSAYRICSTRPRAWISFRACPARRSASREARCP